MYFTNRKNLTNASASTPLHQEGSAAGFTLHRQRARRRRLGQAGGPLLGTSVARYGCVGRVVDGCPRSPSPPRSSPGWVGGTRALCEPSGARVAAVVVLGTVTGS